MFRLRQFFAVSPAALLFLSPSAEAAAPARDESSVEAPVEAPVAPRVLFVWNGDVDREATLVIRGRKVETRGSGIDASLAKYLDVRDDLPFARGEIDVHRANGRGSVEVLQQPAARNDYTAIVRVRDDRSGRDAYRLVVSWRPVIDVPVRYDPRSDDRGRGDERGRNDDWNRGRDDDRGRNGDWNRGRDKQYGNNVMAWRGNVDDVVDIRIEGKRVDYLTRSGQRLTGERLNVRGKGLPRASVTVDVDVSRGRGNVVVVQQPTRYNGYTTIIRVIDRRSGYGDYDFDIFWH